MDEKLKAELVKAIETAELRTGRKFDPAVVYDVLKYSINKLSYIGKYMDYLPLLFENELRDHVMREKINWRGAMNDVLNLRPCPVSQPVS